MASLCRILIMKLSTDFREFIELLNSTGAKYIIVGGYAVAFHGHPRYTGDINHECLLKNKRAAGRARDLPTWRNSIPEGTGAYCIEFSSLGPSSGLAWMEPVPFSIRI
jgi:hypothetical protein